MIEANLKRSLFGYTKSSVYDYITAMNREMNNRIEKANAAGKELVQKNTDLEKEIDELREKQAKMLDEISSYIKEKENLADELNDCKNEVEVLKKELEKKTAEIGELHSEKGMHRDIQNDIADVMIDAKHFANNLKKKAEYDYEQQIAKNIARLSAEKNRLAGYISAVNELCGSVRDLCIKFDVDLEEKKKELEKTYSSADSNIHKIS